MARGRGGPRDGVVGRNYANRADLRGANVVAAQPQNQPGQKMAAQAASGQAYGAASAQIAAQKALPITNPGAGMPTAPQGQGAPQVQGSPFGDITALNAPGDKNQSLFHGMDTQPGGSGSEALQPTFDALVTTKAAALLNSLGSDVSPEVAKTRDWLNANAANGATR